MKSCHNCSYSGNKKFLPPCKNCFPGPTKYASTVDVADNWCPMGCMAVSCEEWAPVTEKRAGPSRVGRDRTTDICRHCGEHVEHVFPGKDGWRHVNDDGSYNQLCEGEKPPDGLISKPSIGALKIKDELPCQLTNLVRKPMIAMSILAAQMAIQADEDKAIFEAIEMAMRPPYALWIEEEVPV